MDWALRAKLSELELVFSEGGLPGPDGIKSIDAISSASRNVEVYDCLPFVQSFDISLNVERIAAVQVREAIAGAQALTNAVCLPSLPWHSQSRRMAAIVARSHRTHGVAEHRTAPCTTPCTTAVHITSPHRTVPHRTAPHRAAPCHSSLHRTAPRRAALRRAAPHCAAPHRTAPRCATPCHTIPHRVALFRAVPCLTHRAVSHCAAPRAAPRLCTRARAHSCARARVATYTP